MIAIVSESTLRLLPLSAHEETVLFAELGALLLVARLLGGLARRVGLARVTGEIAAGLILGPTLFGHLWPAGFAWFLPSDDPLQAAVLSGLSTVALSVLLLVVGIDTDVAVLGRLRRPAIAVTATSIVPAFLVGLVGADVLGHLLDVHLVGPKAVAFWVLTSVALMLSSAPIIARILEDMGATRRNAGQILLSAATLNELFGFLLLASAVAVAKTGRSSLEPLAITLVGGSALIALVGLFGQRTVDAVLRAVRRRDPAGADRSSTASLAALLVVALVAAALAKATGIEAALGAYLAGIVIGRSRYAQEGAVSSVRSLSAAFFAPLYFATAGLRANLALFGQGDLAAVLAVALVIALAVKFSLSALGARLGGLPQREQLAIGTGLNGRGTLQVVAATVGLTAGLIGARLYDVILTLALLTSVVVPPALSASLRGWAGTEEEQSRLSQERTRRSSLVVSDHRLLLAPLERALDPEDLALVAAAWPADAGITILANDEVDGDRRARWEHAALPHSLEVRRSAQAERWSASVLEESALGYGALALVLGPGEGTEALLREPVRSLLAAIAIPILVLRPPLDVSTPLLGPPALRGPLVLPFGGGAPARAARELASEIAGAMGLEILVAHALGTARPRSRRRIESLRTRSPLQIAQRVAEDSLRPLTRSGQRVSSVVLSATDPVARLVRLAEERSASLVVTGAEVELASEAEPFLGHDTERLLDEVRSAVVVVLLPPPPTPGLLPEPKGAKPSGPT
jgi:Kef-type K+ transport system membrane component KefB